MSIMNVILWKEFVLLKKKKTSTIFMMIGTTFIICLFIMVKLKSDGFNMINYFSNINYASIMLAYIFYISFLKFWHEKAMNTLEVLFMLPTNLINIIIGKMLLPMIIALSYTIIFFSMASIIYFLITGVFIFNIYNLLQIIFISFLFQFFYGIINCYAMWCASLTYAKVIQIISIILYLGSIFSLLIIPAKVSFFNSIGIWITIFILVLYALICFLRIDREKAINTLPY